MRRALVILAVVIVFVAPGLARANDPLYPVTSFPDWLGGTQESFQTSSGTYTFDAGWADAAERIFEQLQAHAGDPPARQMQVVIDSLAHMRPDPPYTHIMDAGDPAYSPDWNHDGAFGDTPATTKPGGIVVSSATAGRCTTSQRTARATGARRIAWASRAR